MSSDALNAQDRFCQVDSDGVFLFISWKKNCSKSDSNDVVPLSFSLLLWCGVGLPCSHRISVGFFKYMDYSLGYIISFSSN